MRQSGVLGANELREVLRSCSEASGALAPGETPPLGAHLITPFLGYTHHGIYVGDGKVVHYGALMYDIIRKPVEEVSLADFAEGRPMYVVLHEESAFDAEEVIRRARTRLGEKRYRLLTNNCEHFVEWCLHDVHRSFEVETALNFPRWFGERILAASVRRVRPHFRQKGPEFRLPSSHISHAARAELWPRDADAWPPRRARFGAGFPAAAAACWSDASCGAA